MAALIYDSHNKVWLAINQSGHVMMAEKSKDKVEKFLESYRKVEDVLK